MTAKFSRSLASARMRIYVMIFGVSLWMVVFANQRMGSAIINLYPWQEHPLFLASLALWVWMVFAWGITLVAWFRALKPMLIGLLILSAILAYFIDTYGTIIDVDMLHNVAQTQFAEASDLWNSALIIKLIWMGVFPSLIVRWVKIPRQPFWQAFFDRWIVIVILTLAVVGIPFSLSKYYASFFREHKIVRSYANPWYPIYSLWRFGGQAIKSKPQAILPMATDAVRAPDSRRKIAIVVIGETARADHWGLNGYERDTTPEVKKLNVRSLAQMWSCGTSTAISVPCMFSWQGSDAFDLEREATQENVLDVLQRLGIKVGWWDNNSDSKGVAKRVPYFDYKITANNPICDEECRDMGLLSALPSFIESHPQDSILIVLHQMGNHGPAYYRRYPSAFRFYTPECLTNQLEQCSQAEINNSYDNAIRYTDAFLAHTIRLLEQYSDHADTFLLYASDHGESLGEKGVYLHGMPNIFAPDAQRHVAAMLWLSPKASPPLVNRYAKIADRYEKPMTHDVIVHTLLGYFGVQTKSYQPLHDLWVDSAK